VDLNYLIAICSKRLALNPRHKKALYIRASSYLKNEDFKSAIFDCNSLLELDAGNVNGLFLRGCAFQKTGNMENAIEDFSKVLEIDPNHVNAAFARAACLNKIGEYAKAIEDYQVALDKDEEKKAQTSISMRKISQKSKNLEKSQRSTDKKQLEMGFSFDEVFLNPQEKDVLELKYSNDPSFFKTGGSSQWKSQSFSSEKTGNLTPPNHLTQKELSEWYHLKGYESRKRGDFEHSIDLYTKALEINPHHFKALFNRGFAYDKLHKFQQAIDDYTEVLTLDPNNAYAYYNRGISYDKKGDYKEALEDFTKAIELEAKADFYHNRGFTYRKQGELEKAIQDYTAAISLDNNHQKSLYNRACCYEKLNYWDLAENDYFKALELATDKTNVLIHVANLKLKLGDLASAEKFCHDIIKIKPLYCQAFNTLGMIYEKAGKFPLSIENFSKAIEINGNNSVYLHNRACVYKDLGEYKKAIDDFEKTLKIDPENASIYSNLGLLYRKCEDFPKALEMYIIEAKMNNNLIEKSLVNQAFCNAKLGKFIEAIESYNKLLKKDDGDIHSLYNRGVCYERMGNIQEAIKDFSKIIQINPGYSNAYFNRGCCYDALGELNQAIVDYSKALELETEKKEINK